MADMTDADKLDLIATIAHQGGFADLTTREAMNAIRKLTLPEFEKTKNTPRHVIVSRLGDALAKLK